MGSQSSCPVAVIARGEEDSPFSKRYHPDFPDGSFRNPPEYPTMKELTLRNFDLHLDRPYLGHRELIGENKYAPEFKFKTYRECKEITINFGSGLLQLGIKVGSMLGVYAPNTYEWIHAINASALYGYVIVSLYDTLGVDSVQYLIRHSQMTTILVSSQNARKLLDALRNDKAFVTNIILIDDSIISQVRSETQEMNISVYTFNDICELGKKSIAPFPDFDPETPHFVCYSSGTTGNPKGVVISHRACVSNYLAATDMIEIDPNNARYVSYLPLAHVFERCAVAIVAYAGGKIGFVSGNVTHLTEDMTILKPTVLAAVPRVLYRIYDVIMQKLKESRIKRYIFWGCWYAKRFCINHDLPTFPFDALVFNNINKLMGGCIEQFIIGAAALDPTVHEVLQVATGVPVRTGYGLTEGGSGNVCTPYNIKFCYPGTVGGPLKNVEIKLEPIDDYDDPECGEILMGGQCLSSGYLYDVEATNNLFYDENHTMIHTGDVGKWDEHGYLKVVDRMRSIFKLAQGEYVAAEFVTQVFEEANLIHQIFVYGDSSRTCLVGVVIPEKKEVEKFVGRQITNNSEYEEICKSKELNAEIMKQMNECGKRHKLFGYQYVKAIHVDTKEWTVENDLLTPTFKLRRKKVGDMYKKQIDELYDEIDKKK
ncbi:AMP-binding enzyme family protein [Histomonas meleagridis]|uniref:AMP-binding enzyme family protein n=1 Tax=Histomonas meleagridis TaxID=135588 RepID=UPI00355ABD65|nr:AMP-binding enzyme family protein [Histomonas meleagridis]KAH0804675.1 AMP-binding enzyme family protein [Histomonas meleagridis]